MADDRRSETGSKISVTDERRSLADERRSVIDEERSIAEERHNSVFEDENSTCLDQKNETVARNRTAFSASNENLIGSMSTTDTEDLLVFN